MSDPLERHMRRYWYPDDDYHARGGGRINGGGVLRGATSIGVSHVDRRTLEPPLEEEAAVWLSVHLDEAGQHAGGVAVTSQTAREVARALLSMADSVDKRNGVKP